MGKAAALVGCRGKATTNVIPCEGVGIHRRPLPVATLFGPAQSTERTEANPLLRKAMSIVPMDNTTWQASNVQPGQTGSEYPAIVWLHGSGERRPTFSASPASPAALRLPDGVKDRMQTVICPQLEANALWEPARVVAPADRQ